MKTIGVLDSGIGGLSVLREIQQLIPDKHLIYIADQANLPYGPRSLAEVQGFAEGITRYLLGRGAGLIVIACNTASAAALYTLRERFPAVPFVGMEPAVRPAARDTRRGKIGVIATEATFNGRLFASLIERYANGIDVITRACPELVQLAERGAPYTPADYATVAEILRPLHEAEIDQLVLGCTHFTFLQPLLAAAIGEDTTIIDPAPAVARQVVRKLEELGVSRSNEIGVIEYFTTGSVAKFQHQIETLLGSGVAQGLVWRGGRLLP